MSKTMPKIRSTIEKRPKMERTIKPSAVTIAASGKLSKQKNNRIEGKATTIGSNSKPMDRMQTKSSRLSANSIGNAKIVKKTRPVHLMENKKEREETKVESKVCLF